MVYGMHASRRSGFTLVELAIVLVVLGLIVGAILAGQSAIHSAELRSLLTDRSKYIAAVKTFKNKYSALPGDMTNATMYWGVAHATLATCKTTVGTSTQTCNGDGDGRIGLRATATAYYEFFRAWQHLANAGLVDGSYTGVTGPLATNDFVPGTNSPASKMKGVGARMTYAGDVSGSSSFFDGSYGHLLCFWTVNDSGVTFLQPNEAYLLDAKIDDGKPGTGMVFAYKSTHSSELGCATTAVVSTAAYDVSKSGLLCYFNTRSGF